ncbi:MAG: serine/threonine-protein phosphatase, partial [Candidatus Latescibacterota bacterium]
NITNRLIAGATGDEDFVTLIFAQLDPTTRSLEYVSAGHTTCCVVDRNNAVKASLLSTGPPLGVLRDIRFDPPPSIKLDVGDLVLLLTDGIIEAERGDGQPFGMDNAIDSVRRNRDKSASEIVQALHAEVSDYCDVESQDDDITSIVIKVES